MLVVAFVRTQSGLMVFFEVRLRHALGVLQIYSFMLNALQRTLKSADSCDQILLSIVRQVTPPRPQQGYA